MKWIFLEDMPIIWEDGIVPNRRGDQRYSSPYLDNERRNEHLRLQEELRREMHEQQVMEANSIRLQNRLTYSSTFIAPNPGSYIVHAIPNSGAIEITYDWSNLNRGNMRILDRKTIKKIKFSLKSHDTKMKRSDWEAYYGLMELQENFPLGDEAKTRIKEYRKRIKANIELHAKISPEISTYITLTHDYKTVNFDSKIEGYRYFLNRLKEKINHDRRIKRALNIINKEIMPGISIAMVGLVHTELGTFTDALQRHIIETCFEAKTPKPNIFPYIGLELECFAPIDRRALAKKLKKFAAYIEIKDDGSIEIDDDLIDEQLCDCGDPECEDVIRDSNWQSYEICVLVPESEMRMVIPELLSVLKKIDTRTNDSCGMHVHLDMRNRNTETVFHNLAKYQDILFSLVDSSRLDNTYCRKVDTNYFDEEREDHYNAISGKHAYNRRRTFEVRIHHGSVNETEIMAWLDLLTRMANYPSYMDKQHDLKGLAETISLTNETLEFYNKKIS